MSLANCLPLDGHMTNQSIYITLLSIEIIIPYARSLKDRRSAVRKISDRIRSRFNASVAEVGFQDKWQRAAIAVCMVGSDKRQLESEASRIRTVCDEVTDVDIVAIHQEWL